MNISWIEILIIIITLPSSITFLVSLINVIFNQTLRVTKLQDDYPFVSVLVPIRNEEQNIPKLLNSLSMQDYHNFEIIILDDDSNDTSYQVASSFRNKINNLQIIRGAKLPNKWLGKNWACHQLSENAKGEILIFIDADVILHPSAISTLIGYLRKFKLDALSVFPTQIMHSLGEKLVVPMMNWILLSLLPLVLVRKSKFKSLTAANGQILMFKKEVYQKIGGHTKVFNQPVEDMELAKLVKTTGHQFGTFLGGELVKCNMYKGFIDSIQGYSKNFYNGFKLNWLLFILFILVLGLSNIIPFVLVFSNFLFMLPIFFIIFNRIIVSYLSKQNIISNILLHIPQFIVFLFLAIFSVYKTKLKKNIWKGRPV